MPLSDYFATWFRVRIIMIISLVIAILSVILSGIQTQSAEGDLNIDYISAVVDYNNFGANYCQASPYSFFSPFSFTFKVNYNGAVYDSPTYCGWPTANTALRLTIGIVTFLILIPLFVKTILSRFAEVIYLWGALLWYSAFILDANSYSLGSSACKNSFTSTTMGSDFSAQGITVNCNLQAYILIPLIDFVLASSLFLLWLAWSRTSNLYNEASLKAVAEDSSSTLSRPILDDPAPAATAYPVQPSAPTSV